MLLLHSSAASFAIAVYAYNILCDLTLSNTVSLLAHARCMSSFSIAFTNDRWQSSTVDDGNLRCRAIFCIEHFDSVAMHSLTPGLQCLEAIKIATSSARLIVFSMPCIKNPLAQLY